MESKQAQRCHSHLLKKFSLKTKETNDPRTANAHYHKASGISYASKCQKDLISMAEIQHASQCQLKWPVTQAYNMTTQQKWTATGIVMEKAKALEMYMINGTWLQTQRDFKMGWEQSELTMGIPIGSADWSQPILRKENLKEETIYRPLNEDKPCVQQHWFYPKHARLIDWMMLYLQARYSFLNSEKN